MIAHRLFVLGLAPTKSTYFRLLELMPLLVLAGLWKQGDLTWASGAYAMLGMCVFYKIAPWILNFQLPRLRDVHARDCARLEERIAGEKNPSKKRWLQRQQKEMPQRGHLHLEQEATSKKFEQLAKWLKAVALWMFKR